MKRLEELTDQELIEIAENSEKYKTLVDLECAYNGIPLLPECPGEEPKSEITKPDMEITDICGVNFGSFNDAAKLLEIVKKSLIYDIKYKGGVYVAKEMDDDHFMFPTTSTKKVYSTSLYEKIKDELLLAENAKKEWKARKEEFDAVKKERATIEERIRKRIDDIMDLRQRKAMLEAKYADYLKLSNGDERIALRFLKNAHPGLEKMFPNFFEMLNKPNKKEA